MTSKPSLRVVGDEPARDGDGRKQRSERSRQKIVEAMLEIIREGEMHPSAAQVADRADVSLRTVFRHFEEIDSLYREMTALIEAEVLPMVMKPFTAAGWREQLQELAARRARVYELILPHKVAAGIRRFQSVYLMQDYRRFLIMERALLEAILPEEIVEDKLLFSALEMVSGFQAWRRMRQDQGLSPEEAEAAMRFAFERLTAGR